MSIVIAPSGRKVDSVAPIICLCVQGNRGSNRAAAVDDPINQAHHAGPAEDIAQGDWEEIVGKPHPTWAGHINSAWHEGIQENTQRDEIHVCNGMFEARRNESRNREHDREYLISHAAACHGKPHSQTNQDVAENAFKKCFGEGERALCGGKRDGGLTYGAAGSFPMPGESDENGKADCTEKICEIDDGEIAQ